MRNNKILAAAVASALSLGAGSAFAALELKLLQPGGKNAAGAAVDIANFLLPATPATYAAELFNDNTKTIATDAGAPQAFAGLVGATATDDDMFIVGLKLNIGTDASNSKLINVKATLSNSATWGSDISASQVVYCSSPGIDPAVGDVAPNLCNGAHTGSGVQISKGVLTSLDNQSTADFVIQPVGAAVFNASDWLFFGFDVDDLAFFQNTDGTLNLTMEGSYQLGATTAMPLAAVTIPIAKSKSGVIVAIAADDDPQLVAVDVAKANKEFIKGSTNVKTISLGDITITSQPGVVSYNGSDPFLLGGYPNKKINLTVTNGPFAASRSIANGVYLDTDGVAGFTAGVDIAGTVLSDTTVEWKIVESATYDIDAILVNKLLRVMVVVDGTLEIKPLPSNPMAALEFVIEGEKGKVTSGKLRPIKDNGTKCTLYNIPDGSTGQGSIDKISIRVTNKTSTPGFINGELFDEQGISLFGAPRKLADIGALQTVRFYTGIEPESAVPENELSQYSKRPWGGERARLIITSNVQDLEAVATVRNINGGPQMNMSAGATGNGCEE